MANNQHPARVVCLGNAGAGDGEKVGLAEFVGHRRARQTAKLERTCRTDREGRIRAN
jgi:hypothetical protein